MILRKIRRGDKRKRAAGENDFGAFAAAVPRRGSAIDSWCATDGARSAPLHTQRLGPGRCSGRSDQATSQYRPNLRPTSPKMPTRSKPKRLWSAAEAGLGKV